MIYSGTLELELFVRLYPFFSRVLPSFSSVLLIYLGSYTFLVRILCLRSLFRPPVYTFLLPHFYCLRMGFLPLLSKPTVK